MYLFGGKFCKFTDESTGQERECTCPEIISKHPHCECDRKHFNNVLWATVTVFQVSILTIHFSFFLSYSMCANVYIFLVLFFSFRFLSQLQTKKKNEINLNQIR